MPALFRPKPPISHLFSIDCELASHKWNETITGVQFNDYGQQAEANELGLKIRLTVLMVFGNPNIGTPFSIEDPSAAIDLPTTALIRESAVGKVWLNYESVQCLRRSHGLNRVTFEPVAFGCKPG